MHEKKPPLITNPSDPRFLTLRSLQTPQGRSRTNLYLIEGIRHLARAIEQHAPIESIFIDPSVLSSRFGRKLAYRLHHAGVPSVRLSPQLYRELTLADEPQGIGAVLRQRYVPVADLRPISDSLYLAVESIDSPGNLGTIIHTAEAAGVTGVFLLGYRDDPWHPATVRASMGSLFSQKLIKCLPQEFTAWARSNGVATIASSPDGLLDYRTLRWVPHPSPGFGEGWVKRPAVLLMGSEKRGLSGHLIETSDFTVRIPMRGRCDSINVAVATGVLLFEMCRQPRAG
jgi:RNA methyltransferase, TrmH family